MMHGGMDVVEQELRTPDPEKPTRLGGTRVALASMVGSMVEIYDFVIYGTAAALVFPQAFFPALGSAAGTAASFGTLGVAFVARPVGGVIFGHFGDRLGRKRTLVASLLIMGISTALVGILPTSHQIGVLAPVLLILLRAIQGLAAGGEWAGAVLFAAEHAPPKRRGLWTMFPQLGGNIAITGANLTFLIAALTLSDAQFASWGWRLPFLSSVLLVAVGLWIRVGLHETPVFRAAQQKVVASTLPVADAIRYQWIEILLGAGAGITAFSLQYLVNTWLISYASDKLELARTFVLSVGVAGGIVLAMGVIISASISDRVGRRRVLAGAHACGAIWAVFMFVFLRQPSHATYVMVVLVALLIAGFAFGPLAALLSELFSTRYRYTAAGLSYNLTGIIGGGLVPVAAAPFTERFGGLAFGGALSALSVIALVCTLAMRETREADLER